MVQESFGISQKMVEYFLNLKTHLFQGYRYKLYKKLGYWIEIHRDERRLEETYKDGQLDGSVSLYYKNGQKEWRHTYNHGILDGPYTKWYKNGQRSVEGAFENGDAVGIWAWWNEQGKVIKKEIYKKGTRGYLMGYKKYISKYVISNP